MNELDRFRAVWDMEAGLTTKLLAALPTDQYDFRPDAGGRSLGEMAWHLSEIEGYISHGITQGAVTFQEAPPNMQRPREVRLLAPGYRRVHEEAVALGRDADAPDPSSRAALAAVPAGGWHAAGNLWAEPGGDGGTAG